MTGKRPHFPLPLSSVVNDKKSGKAANNATETGFNQIKTQAVPGSAVHGAAGKYSATPNPGSGQTSAKPVATPQTATQNVVRHPHMHTKPAPAAHSSKNPPSIHARFERRSEPREQNSSSTLTDNLRHAMVSRLSKQGVKDVVVLSAMTVVPRHLFVEPGLLNQAYIDASLPIGHQQTISQPFIVARMTELMRGSKNLKNVLEIGTGCGYQAAVLAQFCENIYSIERIKPLHELAKNNLRSLRIANLRLHYGDGMLGLPQVAPFDGIILAAAGMQIPTELLQQLAIGGRLIAPVGQKQQVLHLIERTGTTEWTKSVLEECHFVPLCSGTI